MIFAHIGRLLAAAPAGIPEVLFLEFTHDLGPAFRRRPNPYPKDQNGRIDNQPAQDAAIKRT